MKSIYAIEDFATDIANKEKDGFNYAVLDDKRFQSLPLGNAYTISTLGTRIETSLNNIAEVEPGVNHFDMKQLKERDDLKDETDTDETTSSVSVGTLTPSPAGEGLTGRAGGGLNGPSRGRLNGQSREGLNGDGQISAGTEAETGTGYRSAEARRAETEAELEAGRAEQLRSGMTAQQPTTDLDAAKKLAVPVEGSAYTYGNTIK